MHGELEEGELKLRQTIEPPSGLVGRGEPGEDGHHLLKLRLDLVELVDERTHPSIQSVFAPL